MRACLALKALIVTDKIPKSIPQGPPKEDGSILWRHHTKGFVEIELELKMVVRESGQGKVHGTYPISRFLDTAKNLPKK